MNAVQKIKSSINKNVIQLVLDKTGAKNISDNNTDAFRSTCPLHGGDNPTSFLWNYENGLWFCFTQCSRGGDIFDFVAIYKNLNIDSQFREVVRTTAELCEIDISNLELGEARSRNAKELMQWTQYIETKYKIKTNPPYDITTIGDLYDINSYRNFHKSTIDFFNAKYSEILKRIVIPIYDENNILVGITCRRTISSEPKWLHYPKKLQTRVLLYNLNNVINEGYNTVYIVEGAFDVWKMYELGIKNVVATFGSHLSTEQENLLLKYFVNINLMYDADIAGLNAIKKVINQLKHKTNLQIIDLGHICKDPGELNSLEQFESLDRLKPYQWLEKYSYI